MPNHISLNSALVGSTISQAYLMAGAIIRRRLLFKKYSPLLLIGSGLIGSSRKEIIPIELIYGTILGQKWEIILRTFLEVF